MTGLPCCLFVQPEGLAESDWPLASCVGSLSPQRAEQMTVRPAWPQSPCLAGWGRWQWPGHVWPAWQGLSLTAGLAEQDCGTCLFFSVCKRDTWCYFTKIQTTYLFSPPTALSLPRNLNYSIRWLSARCCHGESTSFPFTINHFSRGALRPLPITLPPTGCSTYG